MKQILFATTNPSKKVRFQAYFKPLGLRVISFSDLENKIEVVEDGKTPEENALKKAMAGFLATGEPSFGVDYWLRIEGLPEDLQPGPYVRRIFTGSSGQRVEATDDEALEYYIDKIKSVGGKTKGTWTAAIALVINLDKKYVEKFITETIFVSERSLKVDKGEPLNSLQKDPKTGEYLADLTPDELLHHLREGEKRYMDFMKKHIDEI
jgi:8-oxo-dGTP diphosphatase